MTNAVHAGLRTSSAFRLRSADDLRRRSQSAVRTMDKPPRPMRTRSLACGDAQFDKSSIQKPSRFACPAAENPVFTRVSAWRARGNSSFQRAPAQAAQGQACHGAGLNPAVLTAQVGRPDFPGVSAVDLWASGVGSLNLVLEEIHAPLFTQPRRARERRCWWEAIARFDSAKTRLRISFRASSRVSTMPSPQNIVMTSCD